MKKTVKKTILSCLVGTFAVCAAAFTGVTIKSYVSADAATISFVELAEEYSVGDKLQIPSNAAIDYGGKTLTAENCYLLKPDGNALSGEEFTLDAIGEYTLVFEATDGGKKISATKTFKVLKDYYALSNGSSSVSYGELNKTYKAKGMNNGVVAELTEGATLSIAEPINVYAADKVDLFTFNLVRMDTAVNYLSIRITDCYDPDIEIDIQYWKRINQETYLKAGPKGGGLVGLVEDSAGQYAIGGNTYSRGIFGSSTRGNRTQNGNYNNITISFENTADGKIRIWSNTPEHESNPNGDDRLITEINNDKLYGTVFPGFTTGEVNVSVTATGFNNVKTARVEIGNIDGRKNEALDTFGYYTENKKPDIKTLTDDDKIVAGVATKVPEAVAYDASGLRGGVDYGVWYNYDDPQTKRAVSVKDGKFTPTALGTYTVEYRAEDVYGNKATELFDLIAVKTATHGISLAVNEIDEADVGSTVSFVDYTVNSLCKNQTVNVFVTAPSGKTVDVTKTVGNYSVEETGTYKVTYVYSDAFYTGEYEYTFTSVSSGKSVFERSVIPAPEYFIADATYSVEDVAAVYYDGATKKIAATKAYASYDGGAYEEISADEFTVKKGASTIKLKLAALSDETVFIESPTAEIIDVGYNTRKFDVAKYFRGDLTGTATNDYSAFVSTKGGNLSMKFINPLLASKFALSFEVGDRQSLDGFDVVLTDYYDRTRTAVISFNDGKADAKSVSVNGNVTSLTSGWKGRSFEVSCGEGTVTFDGLTTNVDFGFTSDKCLFELKFRSAGENFMFLIAKICNQPFGAQVYDEADSLVSGSLPSAVMQINSVYTTAIPTFTDVLSPSPSKNCKLSVNLTKFGEDSHAPFTDINGTPLRNLSANERYVIEFTEYGCYTFAYSYEDGSGRIGYLRKLVYVYDLVAPTIEFKNKPSSTVKVSVGKEIKPLDVIVSDNLTKNENLEIRTIVYDERGRLITVTDGKFVLNEKGRYTVYIHCKDESGNAASVNYEVYAG